MSIPCYRWSVRKNKGMEGNRETSSDPNRLDRLRLFFRDGLAGLWETGFPKPKPGLA